MSVNPFQDQRGFMKSCGQTITTQNLAQADLYRTLIEEELEELKEAIAAGDPVEEFDAVLDLLVVLIGYGYSRGFPMEPGWREVMRSNLAKVDPETGEVRRRDDGKILKPEGWTPPDLRGVLRYYYWDV